jgi:GGDEF domain-containing protein
MEPDEKTLRPLVQELEKLLHSAFQPTGSLCAGTPVSCSRITNSDGFALSALIVMAALSVLYIAVRSSVYVQLCAATACGLLGMLAVRKRYLPEVEVDEPWLPGRKVFLGDAACLAVAGNEMLQKARKKNQPLSIVVFDFSDLPELQYIYQGQVPRDLGRTIEIKLRSVAPDKGTVVRTGPTTFTVLLPNFDTRKTLRAVCEAFGKACCFEFAMGDNEILLIPDYLVKTIRRGSESVEDVYQVLRAELLKAQLHAKRRQIYLRRERKSHSRPMTLSSTRDAQAKSIQESRIVPVAATLSVAF